RRGPSEPDSGPNQQGPGSEPLSPPDPTRLSRTDQRCDPLHRPGPGTARELPAPTAGVGMALPEPAVIRQPTPDPGRPRFGPAHVPGVQLRRPLTRLRTR